MSLPRHWPQVINRLVGALGMVFLTATPASQAAEPAGVNPYRSIAARDPFRLDRSVRLATAPTEPQGEAEATPRLRLAGVTDVCGRREVILEIGDPDRDGLASILGEHASVRGVEVLEIDVRAGRARIRLGGRERTLTLERPAQLHKK